ncbi:MAG: Cell division inhibitor [uncultured Nocardioidaceae bacterium]|uniref:Cell division inhibitor n=1 Tax=uncultured Nocardioidaceae bacterium TaxID=253824 RepID=A0A6J4M092_9ACTN|nr:MAG: Cell division inhibitor [uncultured Nocardioidaceae bacterium]
MRFVVAGASGFLGSAWCRSLRATGHDVVTLVRREPTSADERRWDPYAGDPVAAVDTQLVASADVVANLAGAPLAHWPWTEAYKRTFRDSRVVTTGVLAQAVARAAAGGRAPALVAQNGVSAYRELGDQVVTEDSPTDREAFIADVARQWEAATEPARDAGARVVVLRTAVVLDRSGSALKSMLPAFKLGLGGPFGSGEQQFATITLTDWVAATTRLATDDSSHGPYNLVGPGTTTQAEFAAELARQLHRPARFKVPAGPLRKVGGVAGAELLYSARVEPRRLLDEGFAFAHPDLPTRVAAALHQG